MELNFSTLKCKQVININDGQCLGKTKDLVFEYPEGKIRGIVVSGTTRFFCFSKEDDLFIDWKRIITIGEDVVLTKLKETPPDPRPCPPPRPKKDMDRRSYDEYE